MRRWQLFACYLRLMHAFAYALGKKKKEEAVAVAAWT